MPEKLYLNEEDMEYLFYQMAEEISIKYGYGTVFYMYPIPRGGVPIAYRLLKYFPHAQIVDNPEVASILIDDIIDTGTTRARYFSKYPTKSLYALIKRDEKNKGTWYVFPYEQKDPISGAQEVGIQDSSAEDIPLRFLEYIGEDPKREGLKDTPQRMIKSWDELYDGYGQKPEDILGKCFENTEKYDEMVILKNIEFYSTCEHHCLPFFGKVHIAYLPDKKIVGISKLARLVNCFAHRLQIQERFTEQIAGAIVGQLKPLGTAVFVEAQHLCMLSRGIQKQNSVMVTSSINGVLEKEAARMEFLLLSRG